MTTHISHVSDKHVLDSIKHLTVMCVCVKHLIPCYQTPFEGVRKSYSGSLNVKSLPVFCKNYIRNKRKVIYICILIILQDLLYVNWPLTILIISPLLKKGFFLCYIWLETSVKAQSNLSSLFFDFTGRLSLTSVSLWLTLILTLSPNPW